MALPEYFEFQCRTKIKCGMDVIDEIGAEARLLGGARAVIVTDKVVRGLGFVDRMARSLAHEGVDVVHVFDDVPVDSDVNVCQRAHGIAREKGADITIAHGGGSALDTAKGMNILLSEGGDLVEDHQGAGLLTRPLKPLIAVPTTAGTGSEVTFAAVIKDPAENIKLSFYSPYLSPDTAILDPAVTQKMPPGLTAATGLDALTHCIECTVSTMASPITSALAFGAIRDIAKHLRRAVADGDDMEARGHMLVAACTAGLAFANALCGIVHGIAHSVGAISHVPHGVANAILLPWCMEWNLDHALEQYADIALAMGASPRHDARATALEGIALVRALCADIGLPQTLSQAGVQKADLAHISDITLGDGSVVTNPRPVEDEAHVLEILEKAF
jgi:alcohol dehydrogenase class IV